MPIPKDPIKAEIWKKRQREAHLGKHIHSEEMKKKYSDERKGKNHPNYGKHLSQETKNKISKANKGKLTGDKNPAKRPEVREKIRANAPMKQPGAREKLSKSKMGVKRPDITGKNNPMYGIHRMGKDATNWKGGLSYEPYCPKFNKNLKERIRAFFNHECMICGKTTNENIKQLCCHHVEYNKEACCDGKQVQFAALCIRCHLRTNNERDRWENIIHRVINEIYDGRSYYTKEEMVERVITNNQINMVSVKSCRRQL